MTSTDSTFIVVDCALGADASFWFEAVGIDPRVPPQTLMEILVPPEFSPGVGEAVIVDEPPAWDETGFQIYRDENGEWNFDQLASDLASSWVADTCQRYWRLFPVKWAPVPFTVSITDLVGDELGLGVASELAIEEDELDAAYRVIELEDEEGTGRQG
jgi:hypothetical protein